MKRLDKLNKAVDILYSRALAYDYINDDNVRKILREEKYGSKYKIKLSNKDIDYIMDVYSNRIYHTSIGHSSLLRL